MFLSSKQLEKQFFFKGIDTLKKLKILNISLLNANCHSRLKLAYLHLLEHRHLKIAPTTQVSHSTPQLLSTTT